MADGRLRKAGRRFLRRSSLPRLAALLALVLLAPSPAAATDDGLSPLYPRNRVETDTYQYPWSAIGRVTATGRGVSWCTGTLVSERVVVTAAHCLWNKNTDRYFPPEFIHFVAGYQREVRLAHSKVRRFHAPEQFDYDDPGSQRFIWDWAILELEEPIGREVGYVGWGRLDEPSWRGLGGRRARFQSVGYRTDRRHVQTVDRDCGLTGFEGTGLVTHLCPIIFGDSGGPLLFRRTVAGEEQIFLIGINVGMRADYERRERHNLMVPSANFSRELRDFGLRGVQMEQTGLFGTRGLRPATRPVAEEAGPRLRKKREPKKAVPFPGS